MPPNGTRQQHLLKHATIGFPLPNFEAPTTFEAVWGVTARFSPLLAFPGHF